jgi:hypothetical protein
VLVFLFSGPGFFSKWDGGKGERSKLESDFAARHMIMGAPSLRSLAPTQGDFAMSHSRRDFLGSSLFAAGLWIMGGRHSHADPTNPKPEWIAPNQA